MTRRKMAIVEDSIEIAAPPDVVFRYAQTPERRQDWDSRVVRAFLRDALKPGEGALLRVVSRAFGRVTFDTDLRYLAFQPPVRTVVKIERVSGPTLISEGGGAWTLEPTGLGTRFTTRFSYAVRGGILGRFLDRLWLRRWIGTLTRESLRNLKSRIEASFPAAGAVPA